MTPEVACGLLVLFLAIIGSTSISLAYQNGVTDGYGFAKEPSCPGYQKAGEYLKKHMSHRWPELKDKT